MSSARIMIKRDNTVNARSDWMAHSNSTVEWVNQSDTPRAILFAVWPFMETAGPIYLGKKGDPNDSVTLTINPMAPKGNYNYGITPYAVPDPQGPPDGPAVVVDP